jgi:hypothetical protein
MVGRVEWEALGEGEHEGEALMTLTVTFTDPAEACRWLRHMSKFKPLRVPAATDATEIESDARWQAIEHRFHGLTSSNGRKDASHAPAVSQPNDSE